MRRALRWLARTALFVGAGAVVAVALGQLYGLTQAACSSLCSPHVSGPLGALAGLLAALMLPSLRWKPLDGA